MAALEPQYMTILKTVLAQRFVPSLPPLLDTTKPPGEQQAKQLSRAFSAFALHKMLDITPQAAAASVVDDFNDKGIDAIHYDASSETLYLLQTKLQESEQFKQEDALPFCEGVRLLLKQDFTAFNKNVTDRKVDIEGALDACSHIKLVVPYTGDGVSKTASDALQSLLDDEDLDEERLAKPVTYNTATEIVRDLLAERAYTFVDTSTSLAARVRNTSAMEKQVPPTSICSAALVVAVFETLENGSTAAWWQRGRRVATVVRRSRRSTSATSIHSDGKPLRTVYANWAHRLWRLTAVPCNRRSKSSLG